MAGKIDTQHGCPEAGARLVAAHAATAASLYARAVSIIHGKQGDEWWKFLAENVLDDLIMCPYEQGAVSYLSKACMRPAEVELRMKSYEGRRVTGKRKESAVTVDEN